MKFEIQYIRNDGVKAINIHITGYCNYKCKFCFAKTLTKQEIGIHDWIAILRILKENGFIKVNFVGGEPFLYDGLLDICREAKKMGFITGIVTNGSLLSESKIEKLVGIVDCIGFSIDSVNENVEIHCGRGNGNHISNVIKMAQCAHENNIDVKLNITVIKLSVNDDFSPLIKLIDPSRVKVFRELTIDGVNDEASDEFSISETEFDEFRHRHSNIILSNGRSIVFEDNEDMIDSYLMIDPICRVMSNSDGSIKYHPLGDVLDDIHIAIDPAKYLKRGGNHFAENRGDE